MTSEPAVEPIPAASAAPRRSRRWIVLLVIFVALAVRGRAMLSMHNSLHGDPDGYRALAWSVHDAVVALRMAQTSADPTAYRPPLYPLVLSVCDYLPDATAAYGLLHVLLGAGTVLAVWRLGELGDLPPAASFLAALLVAVDPILINQASLVMNETLATFLAMWTIVALARLRANPSILFAVVAGAAAALCVLCRPTFLVWIVLVAAALPFLIAESRRRAVLLTAVYVAAAAVVIAPWAVRNWIAVRHADRDHHARRLHAAVGATIRSFYEYLRSGAWGSVWDAREFHNEWADAASNDNDAARDRTWHIDELAADRLAYRLARQNIANEPAMFAYACLVRVGRLWGVLPHQLHADESPTRRGLRYCGGDFLYRRAGAGGGRRVGLGTQTSCLALGVGAAVGGLVYRGSHGLLDRPADARTACGRGRASGRRRTWPDLRRKSRS